MELDLPQGHHGPDRKVLGRFLNFVQPKARQVDGGADIDVLHLEPDHAADDPIVSLLVELPGFLELSARLYSRIVIIRSTSLFSIATFILSQNPL